MKQEEAIIVAQRYADNWGVPWGTVTKIQKRRGLWFLISEYTFYFQSDYGYGEVVIWGSEYRIYRFEFYPNDDSHDMLPLWAAFPGRNSMSSLWRQSYGQRYKYFWHR